MIGTSAFLALGLMIAFGTALPVTVSAVWLVKKKEKLTTLLIGCATWFLFAIVFESIPKLFFFTETFSLGRAVLGNPVLYTVVGVLMAGIFEETGRFVAFKTLLRKNKNKTTAITHGIGHGGFEALFVMALPGVEYLVFAVLINQGLFQSLIDQTAGQGEAALAAMEALPAQIASMTPGTACISLLERVFAMLLHVGLSILVFYAVQRKKTWLYPLAILFHALFDVPAALYQVGLLDLYVVEALIALYSVAFFLLVYFLLYRKDREPVPAGQTEPANPPAE